MPIRKFQPDSDLQKLESYLRNQYRENQNMTSWLPERLHDLVYRVAPHEADGGRKKSTEYMFFWEENGEIVACILPDGENIYFSIQKGFEPLFPSLLAYSEKHCLPLFPPADDGSIKFWVALSDRLTDLQKILVESGYTRYAEEEYEHCVYPHEEDASAKLPGGFRLLYGDEYVDEVKKWGALHLGFHPEHEEIGYKHSMNPYISRKNSSMYQDSFECIVVDENARDKNDVCAYCFVYVDQQSKSAFIEPVSTREKYRRRGIGTAMMHGVILRCKEKGIEKCYVNSFGWRRKFYNAAGFTTEGSTGFWHKVIR